MSTLTLIGDPFPDWEAEAHAAAAIDLTAAVAETAPRGFSSRLLLTRDEPHPTFDSPRAQVETLPLKAGLLPVLWQSRATARPLDGEFVHALTPMVPLRSRGEDDGSQTSVMVPHCIAWQNPEMMGGAAARLYRSFVKRAVKLADMIVTPAHTTAAAIQGKYGDNVPVQVLPLAAPTPLREPADAAARRSALGLPPRYIVTTSSPDVHGRLDWLLNTLTSTAGTELPHLVVVTGCFPWEEPDPQKQDAWVASLPEALRHRFTLLRLRDLKDMGAVLAGAELLVQPQVSVGTGYCVLGALSSGVPVLHAGSGACTELVLDAGIAADTEDAFSAALVRVFAEPQALSNLRVLAGDRGRAFSWQATAWQLWELHANL